ncbi:hypothetical protein ABQ333_13780 [Serratia fonticola]|uniref:hypothetical protein n=2 Tax=Serratia fonticola TaxID=47917 RepID=UPI003AAA83D5
MTKSTLTTETITGVADLNAGYTLGHADVAILKALAAELLAVREAKPVASTTKSNIDAVLSGVSAVIWPVRCFKGEIRVDLYTAPPAPAVPVTAHSSVIAEQLANVLSSMNATNHQQAVIGCAVDRLNNVAEILQRVPSSISAPKELDYQQAKELYNYLMTEEEINATVNGWNACRAAMLQPVSQGYTFDGLNIRAVAALRESVRNQWLKSEDFADKIYWKNMHSIANEIIEAMAAAPAPTK